MNRIPEISKNVSWCINDGKVLINMENKGLTNFLMQKIFHKPEITVIHLDKIGSFIWRKIDGKNTIQQIAKELKANFGESIYPLYERLYKYFDILSEYKFIVYI